MEKSETTVSRKGFDMRDKCLVEAYLTFLLGSADALLHTRE